jgi:hypothetical protein
MSEPNSRESDLILGGQNSPPTNAAILGGLAGVKQRLASELIGERIQALNNAVIYSDDGIDLTLRSLKDNDDKVRRLAKRLLRDRFGEAGKEALLDREPMSYFNTFHDWKQEIYNPEVGIVDPENISYVVTITYDKLMRDYNMTLFDTLIKDAAASQIQALILKVDYDGYNCFDDCLNESIALDIFKLITSNRDFLISLKALSFSDRGNNLDPVCRKSNWYIKDISILLNELPNLEILHIYGDFSFYNKNIVELKHNKLKTLVIDAQASSGHFYPICPTNMPNLEYFEIWLDGIQYDTPIVEIIVPILSRSATPKLIYLGLCNCECVDSLIEEILKMPIMKELVILSFKMGTMSEFGLKNILIHHSIFDNLKLLNVERNCISDEMIGQLIELPFKVEASNQYQSSHERDCHLSRYWLSNEY